MKKSFTLIELLVVIAIIAILAAMLMPALQQVHILYQYDGQFGTVLAILCGWERRFSAAVPDEV